MRGPRAWPLYVVPLLIFGLGVATIHFDGFRRFRDYVGQHQVPETLMRSGRTGRELRLLDYKPLAGTHIQGFDSALPGEDMPSTSVIDKAVIAGGLPTLSIVVDSEDLLNRDTGLLVKYDKRGRAWERPAYASYFVDGRLAFATGVGLRVHGGKSRAETLKSFRLYFRDLYGKASIERPVLFPGPGGSLRSIVVHNDVRRRSPRSTNIDWHYTNPLAYDVARRIGCITPATQPIAFYLNGVYQGPYVLTEHVTTDFLVNRFGHDDFVFADTKSDDGSSVLKKGSQKQLDELRRLAKSTPPPLTMAEVERHVDLANLTNWFISYLYAGTTDPFQGFMARDRSVPGSRWFWINWDMDHSFQDWFSQAAHPWELDTFTGRLPVVAARDPRSLIFHRLRTESPEFRIAFLTRLTEVLNHDLDEAFMRERIEHYEDAAIAFGIDDLSPFDVLREYIKHRPAVLRAQMNEYFNSGPSYKLTVRRPPAAQVRVDNREVAGTYTGWYFADTPARIEIAGLPKGATISWMVNDVKQPLATSELELRLKADTTVELLLQ